MKEPRTLKGYRVFGGAMRLNLFFILFDLSILVIYPFAFLAGKIRQVYKIKR